MMLTRTTAAEMGVEDRLSAEQSISGGARYYRRLYDLLPDDLPDPHKTWMALASYNLGRGHLLRARQLAANAGGDKNDWQQLREFILALENGSEITVSATDTARSPVVKNDINNRATTEFESEAGGNVETQQQSQTSTVYYPTTENLNGRGLEAIRYVDNVRRYYDMLVWISENESNDELSTPTSSLE